MRSLLRYGMVSLSPGQDLLLTIARQHGIAALRLHEGARLADVGNHRLKFSLLRSTASKDVILREWLQRSLLNHEHPNKLWATNCITNSLILQGGEKHTRSCTASDQASSWGGGGRRGRTAPWGAVRGAGAGSSSAPPRPSAAAGSRQIRVSWRLTCEPAPSSGAEPRGRLSESARPVRAAPRGPLSLRSPATAAGARWAGRGAPRPRGEREGRCRARPGGSPRTARFPAVPPSCRRGAAWAAARAAPVAPRPVESETDSAAGRLAGYRPAERPALALRGRSAACLVAFARLFSVVGVVSAKSHACGFLEDLRVNRRFCFSVRKGAGSDTLTGYALPLLRSRLRGESGRRPVKQSLQMTALRCR